MTFAHPALLWSLAALLPLLAIYFLKVRPRRRPATAFFLWKQVVQQRRSNRLFHRLRDIFSLLLMAAAFAALALALAEPRFHSAEGKDLLIVIDTSASMNAADPRATRLDQAKSRAASIVRALDGVQRAAIATVGHDLEYRSHLTDNPRTLLAAIDAIKPTAETLRLEALPREQKFPAINGPTQQAAREAIDAKSAESASAGDTATASEAAPAAPAAANDFAAPKSTDWRDSYRVLLISDGGFAAEQLPPGIELLKIGGAVENLGLVAADLGFYPNDSHRLMFYYQLASTATETKEVDLTLSQEREGRWQLTKVIPVRIEPGLNPPQVFQLDDAEPGRWQAAVDFDDALPSDNQAYFVARKMPPIRAEISADNRFFFEQSVLAFARDSDLLQLVDADPDVTLATGTPPDAARLILFHPAGESPWWSDLGEEVDVAAPRLLVEGHPVLEHVDASTINFAGARALRPPPGSQVLVASENDVPLVYVANRAGKSAIVVNLDPLAADFYFSAWFPVLIRSASLHLAGRHEALAATYAPRASVPLPGATEASLYQVTRPNGASAESSGDRFRDLRELGFYDVTLDKTHWPLACSQLSAGETLLNATDVSDTARPIASGSLPASQLTIFALLVLVGESILYHRRKVG